MTQDEFVDCFKAITVSLNWTKMASEAWPVSHKAIETKAELNQLFIPWYATSAGTFVPFNAPDANPLSVSDAHVLNQPCNANVRARIIQYQAIFGAYERESKVPVELVLPAYVLPNSELLLLDGTHRVLALVLGNVAFKLSMILIEGPCEEAALPDLRHWCSSP